MKKIDSEALVLVNRILGLAGGGFQQSTELDDANLSLVFEIAEATRRARALGVTEGWFVGYMDNVHVGAGTLASTQFPYEPVGPVNAYPGIVRPGFDVWITSVSLHRVSGSGDMDGAILEMDPTARHQGWGVNNSAAAVVADTPLEIARWSGLDSATTTIIGITGDGNAMVRTLIRVNRGVQLRFISDATAAATFRCALSLALFPEALGQDVAS